MGMNFRGPLEPREEGLLAMGDLGKGHKLREGWIDFACGTSHARSSSTLEIARDAELTSEGGFLCGVACGMLEDHPLKE